MHFALLLAVLHVCRSQEEVSQTSPPVVISYLKQQELISYHATLKSDAVGYTKAQIAEIGGTSIAKFVIQLGNTDSPIKRILVVVGQEPQPTSFQNAYFGLAAARQLQQRKFEVEAVLLYPSDALRSRLTQQCKANGVKLHFNVIQKLQAEHKTQITKHMLVEWLDKYDLIIDAITAQTSELNQPMREFIYAFAEVQKKVLSIDLPSGWNANEGNINGLFTPNSLFSVGLPLKGTKDYKGRHGIGGRFAHVLNFTGPRYHVDEDFVLLRE